MGNRPAASESTAITMQEGHSDQGSQTLAAQRAQLWEAEHQGAGTDRANP
jgi:hypothetical protein